MYRDLVVEPRRRTQAGRAIVSPIGTNLGLIRGALRGRNDPVTAEALCFIESGGVFRAVQDGRPWNPKLVRRFHDKRLDLTPAGAKRERVFADWVLAPFPRFVARSEVDTDLRFRMF